MNLYFLVEGRRTESIVYPKWLSLLLPDYKRIWNPFSLKDGIKGNHYYLFDGGGYPNMLKDAVAGSMDINEIGAFDYYVICLDTDDSDRFEREQIVRDRIEKSGVKLHAQLVVITQQICIETWFLGNKRLLRNNIKGNDIDRFIDFYNVADRDPELMQKPTYCRDTTAIYHFKYLETLMRKNGLKYSKSKPYNVCEKEFLEELIVRAHFTNHLNSFKKFIDFCMTVKKGHIG